MKKSIAIFLILLLPCLIFSKGAREDGKDFSSFPEREVTVICPWAVGGVADIVSRSTASFMKEEMGVPFLSVNELGAGGNVALSNYTLSNDSPYELILASEGQFAIAPNVEGSEAIIFSYSDFVPIINFYSSIMVLTVNADLGLFTLDDLERYGKENRLTVAVNGASSAEAFLVRALFDELGLNYVLVSYNGANLALSAAARGETDIAISHQSQAKISVESGTLIPLLVFDEKRSDNPPFVSVPSIKELGYNTYFPNTCCLFARSGTDEEVIKKIQDAYLAVFQKDEIITLYENLLIEMDPMLGSLYDEHVRNVERIVMGAGE